MSRVLLGALLRSTCKDSGGTDGCADGCAVDMGAGVARCDIVLVPGLEFPEKSRMV